MMPVQSRAMDTSPRTLERSSSQKAVKVSGPGIQGLWGSRLQDISLVSGWIKPLPEYMWLHSTNDGTAAEGLVAGASQAQLM